MSREGLPVARFDAEGTGLAPERSDQAARLRELEKLRADGLVTEAYARKRAEILEEDW
jgi:hypothetical protein